MIRSRALLPAVCAVALLGGLLTGPTAQAAAWQLKWSPSAAKDGLAAFEGVEDDRAGSHPGVKHIYVQNGVYRFDMHMKDRDSSTDRQRQEVKGMRSPAGGPYLEWKKGETWRLTYSMYIPASLKATTTFTHIMQMKMPGNDSSPILTTSLRRYGSTPKIELNVENSGVVVGSTNLAPLQNKWIDVDFELKIGDAPNGSVHWVIRDGSTTVLDIKRGGLDTWLSDRVRPKWGIYRSLGDKSGSLQDCYLLLRDLKAYKLG
ncbi:heparin lyase I family protein [Planotetraspora sp. GP83]|uniref:heparin lyase I family protein n=1 Tax=Planotetraspora sp. GP83 TaxID=3156264 RepID=UPI003517EFE6